MAVEEHDGHGHEQLLVLVVCLLLWHVLTETGLLDPFFFAQPWPVLQRTWTDFASGVLWYHLWITILEALLAFLIGTALGWGGNPDRDATYLNITPPKNDGTTVYKLTVKDVPVNAFWSISLYNAEGYFEKNPYNAYSVNNITGRKGADGSITIQFGGCDGKIPNCLPIMKGWNYTVRLYRQRAEILNGK